MSSIKRVMPSLYLNLKGQYFDEIKSDTKEFEYRLHNKYWQKRLLDEGGNQKTWNQIVIRRGYPRAGDPEREIVREWQGLIVKTITHPHFGADPVEVFAIRVNNCDHDWSWQDNSFDHEFGTEICGYRECGVCGELFENFI